MIKLIRQIWRFGIVGGICTIVDFAILTVLHEFFDLHYLIANGFSFAVSVVFNYVLSMRYVFQGKEDSNKTSEFIIFVILSAIGLGLNQLIMWGTVDGLGIYYVAAKVIATAIVMIYNFVTRKLLLEKK